MKAITKHAGGRPSKYTPQAIEDINQYLQEATPQNMKIPTVEGIALKLGINRDTLYEWAKKYPEFSDTLDKLKMLQKESLTEIGIFGGKEINASIVKLLLEFNHGMKTETGLQLSANEIKILVVPSELVNKYEISQDTKSSGPEQGKIQSS